MEENPPVTICSVCGADEDSDEIVVLSFEQNGFVFARAELCPVCVGFLSWVTDDDSVEVELDSDSPRFGRWEAVGGCGSRPEPCLDIRPCPAHTPGLVN